MLFQKVITKKTSFVFLIIAGLFLGDVNFAGAVGWTPLTDLSKFGIPAGPISLSDFIIFVYDFLLSAVGIAAMLMIVLGGFRYLTAAGNAASLTEAKDIIYNALYGLALAICAWIIISTINPDLIYLKKPGADVSHLNYSCIYEGSACNTDAAQDGCNTGSLVDPDCQLAGATSAEGDGCDPAASPADPDCFYEIANCCNGTCSAASDGTCPDKPLSCVDPIWPISGVSEGGVINCKCIDGEKVGLVPFVDCNAACQDNCGWRYLVTKLDAEDYGTWDGGEEMFDLNSDAELWEMFLTNNGEFEGFKIPDSVTSYTVGLDTYYCAVLTIDEDTLGIDEYWIYWVEEGASIGYGSSFRKDVDPDKSSNSWTECCEMGIFANKACKIAATSECKNEIGVGPERIWYSQYKETDIENHCGICSNPVPPEVSDTAFSISNTAFKPNSVITCTVVDGKGFWRKN